MKKTNKFLSMILSVIMLIGMLPTISFATAVPTELFWSEYHDGVASFVPIDGVEVYLLELYKGPELIDKNTVEDYAENFAEEDHCGYVFSDTIEEYGNGSYTFRVGVCSDTYDEYTEHWDMDELTVLAWSDLSGEFVYTRPSTVLTTPTITSFNDNSITWSNPNTFEDMYCFINFYADYGNNTVWNITSYHDATNNITSIDLTNVMATFTRVTNNLYNIDPETYDKNNYVMKASITAVSNSICDVASSSESELVSYGNAGSSDNTPPTELDKTVISADYKDYAKIAYNLDIMPDIYTNYNQNVNTDVFSEIVYNLCGNAIELPENQEMKYAQIIKVLVSILGYDAFATQQGGYPTGYLACASRIELNDGISAGNDDTITYEQLTRLIANALDVGLMKQISWGSNPSYETTNDTLLYKLGYSKYLLNASVEDNALTGSGMLYNSDNIDGTSVNDISLTIKDDDIKIYAGTGFKLYVKNNEVIAGVNADVPAPEELASGTCGATSTWVLTSNGVLTISGTGEVVCDTDDYFSSYDGYQEVIKEIIVEEGITSLGDSTTYEIYNLEKISLPSTLEKIGIGFVKGSKVSNVVIPANVSSIDMEMSFVKCPNIEIYFLNPNTELIKSNQYGTYVSGAKIYGYSGSNAQVYADANSCEFISINPDFTINDGAESTETTELSITFNDYAKNFTEYRINDGDYTTITDAPIKYTVDNADGIKTITITFKSENIEITKSHTIMHNNKHTITYKINGAVYGEVITVGCGAETPDMPSSPSVDGYTFIKWDAQLPETMPDKDIIINAVLTAVDTSNFNELLTEEEITAGYEVKADVSVAADNSTVETALINTYSKYTAALKLDITLEKGKEGETPTEITETNNLITFTIDIPTEVQGKAEYIIIREHEGEIHAITTRANSDGEYIEIQGNKIILHAKKFSTYVLLAKDAEPVRTSGGGGGVSTYTVKFDTNGGNEIKSVKAKRNAVITAPTAPVKDGYTFEGWYSDKELTQKYDFSSKIIKGITLYAKWTENAKVSILLTIGKKDATINGKTVANDVAPKIVNERTVLPIRFIAEALGAKVEWYGETNTVKIYDETMDIVIVIGEAFATVNGEKIDLDCPSFIENDRTYMPIRFITEKLGADVVWNGENQTVSITK